MMWRFVHLTDPHLAALSDTRGNNILIRSRMPELISCLRRDLARLDPRFILATGDLVGQHSRDAMFAARDLLDSLGYEYYPVGGNQDFLVRESRKWFLEAYGAHLPADETYYSYTHENLHVCILDAWWVWPDGTLCGHRDGPVGNYGWAIPPHQRTWVQNDLAAHRDVSTLVALHYPLVPIPERLRKPGMIVYGHLANGDLVMEILTNSPNVVAVFSGHAHMNFIEEQSGIVHIATSALTEYPAEFRDIHVYEDRLEVHTLGLSDKSFAALSLVQFNTWTAGEDRDRTTVIPLRGKRGSPVRARNCS